MIVMSFYNYDDDDEGDDDDDDDNDDYKEDFDQDEEEVDDENEDDDDQEYDDHGSNEETNEVDLISQKCSAMGAKRKEISTSIGEPIRKSSRNRKINCFLTDFV